MLIAHTSPLLRLINEKNFGTLGPFVRIWSNTIFFPNEIYEEKNEMKFLFFI